MIRPHALPQPQLPAWRRIAVAAILLAGLIALLNLTGALAQVRGVIPGLGAATPTYQTSTVSRGNVAVSVTATGPISAVTSIPLSFKESGKLTQIKVNVGDHVTKGQVLATLDTTDLQISLEQAKATLAQAQANLAKVQAGATSQSLAVAQTGVDNAKKNVTDAQASLAATKASTAQDLQAAQNSVGSATTTLANSQASLASAQDQASKAIAADQVSLASAQKNLAAAKDQQTKQLAADELAITNAQKNLDGVKATIAANQPVLLQQIEQAKDSLWSAQTSRDATCGRDKGASCQAANATVAAAETAVNTAQANLTYQQKQADQQVATAQASLDTAKAQQAKDQSSLSASIVTAQNALAAAQAQQAKDQSSQQAAIVSAQNQVKQNQAALQAAQTAVGQAQAKSDASLQSAQAQVTSAQNAVQTAQASYDQTAAPPQATDVATAQAQVQSAQAAVDAAQLNLDSANLTAPFDGTIAAVNGSVGQWISGGTVAATSGSSASTTAIFTEMDLNNLQVVSQVNEADISKVKIGDPVTFNVSAFADQTFQGKVIAVQPVGTTSSNVVVYNVTSSIQSAKNAALYPGMTATVTIVSAQSDNVLTVPNTALTFAQTAIRQGLVQRPGGATGTARATTSTRSTGATSATGTSTSARSSGAGATGASTTSQSYVVTLNQGKLTLVPVTTGLSDGSVTAIDSALKAGDAVVTGQSGSGATSRSTGSAGSTTRTSSPLGGGGPPG